MISIEELEGVEDPLELYRLSSEAILQRQADIDRFADIRARSIAALQATGLTNRDIGKLLGLSPPRVSQLLSSNSDADLEIMKAWTAIEESLLEIVRTAGVSGYDSLYSTARRILEDSRQLDSADLDDLDELWAARSAIVHGRRDISEAESERLTDKAIYLSAALRHVSRTLRKSLFIKRLDSDAETANRPSHRPAAAVRPGLRFGQWTTTRPLSRGSSGELWEVRDSSGEPYVIKIFRVTGSRDRVRRFKDEIGFLQDYSDHPGVLPLVDSSLDRGITRPLWYVTPKAIPAKLALGTDPDPVEVVSAIATVADTLAALASKGIYHRDIKPANLFKLQDDWVVGDFGLATYPEKEPVTAHGKKLGPVDYMAPDMRLDTDSALPGPADVWALAKTLWVLLTGYSLPLPGPHRPSDPAYMLYGRIKFDRSRELDLLLERATQIDPNARVSMSEMALELHASTSTPPEETSSADLADLTARVAALTDPERRKVLAAQERRDRVQAAGIELAQLTQKVGEDLQQLLGFDSSTDSGYAANMKLGSLNYTAHTWYSTGISLRPPGPRPQVKVDVATAMRISREGEPAMLSAVLNVVRLSDGLEYVSEIWSATFSGIPVGSARQAQAFAAIRAGFANSLQPAIVRAVEILADVES